MSRSKIQTLPDELKVMVATSIDDPETLMNLAFVDKGFYNLIKGDEAKLCARLFKKQIGDKFLRLAVAVAHARALQRVPRTFYGQPRSRLDLSVEDIMDFVDTHFPSPVSDAIVPSDRTMGLKLCAELFAFHRVVDNYADVFSRSLKFKHDGDGNGSEQQRVRKALYILQLLSNLFPRGRVSQRNFKATERAYQPAWAYLLTRFAPWELQQARCAKQLLARHIERVIHANVLARGESPISLDRRLSFAFISNEGLFALKKLEDSGITCGTLGALTIFRQLSKNWEPTELWYDLHDSAWISQFGQPIHLDVTDILNRYPDSDTGPRDVWLYTLLAGHINNLMFDTTAYIFLYKRELSGIADYVFWGRQKLDGLMLNHSFPSAADMLSVANVHKDLGTFLRFVRFRTLSYSLIA
ncbi:hypothetical protein SLS62_010360 [Diatrype stigma]|uniref:F-box domain-containing protein n=1 Tax=Diatrype stigma TaxID=117547 RepID=A0AAN9UGY5_9PEZI